ncbi:MAG: hypothetical protein QM702_00245 [Rubrivivax sp.]
MIELDSIVTLTESELQLRHPVTAEPLQAWITLAGPEHDARKGIQWQLMRRRRAEFAEAGEIKPTDPADDEAVELEVLTATTLSWRGIAIGGAEVAFSAEACRRLYADPKRSWIRDQVRRAWDDRARFIGSFATA